MEKLVAKTYAQALYEVALEQKQLDPFGKDIEFVLEVFEQHPSFYELYKTPQIGSEEKKLIIDQVFKDKINSEVVNFLKILLDKRRAAFIGEIAKEYKRLANVHDNIVEALAITAVPLSNEDKSKLEIKLSNITGKNVKVKHRVDPTVLGGMFVRIGDQVIDGTVQNRLNELQESLAQIIV